MDLLREKLRCKPEGAVLRKGGGGGGSNSSNTTSNADKRNAVQNGVGISGDSNSVVYNDPDAVKAMAAAGADVLKNVGGSVVDLNRDSLQANGKSFDAVVDMGAKTLDRLIDASVRTSEAGTALATTAVQSFKPVENSNADIGKYAMLAAAAVAGAVLLKGAK